MKTALVVLKPFVLAAVKWAIRNLAQDAVEEIAKHAAEKAQKKEE